MWRQTMKWPALLVFAAFACSASVDPRLERGVPPVALHESHAFGAGAEFQNMAAHRLADGRVLVANTGGMVLFDGARWRTFPHPRGLGTLWSLVPTEDGRFYGGFSGDIGWFAPDGRGGYDWHSATHLLPEDARDFGTVWSAVGGSEGVWFSAADQTMLLRKDGGVQVFPTVRFGVFLFRIGAETWLNDRGVGLLRAVTEGDSVRLEAIEGGESLNGMPILGASALGDNDVIIANAEGELHRWKDGVVQPFAEALWPRIAPLGVQTVLALRDGTIAIGFMRSGPWIIDRDGVVLERYGDAEGVPPLTTFLLSEDEVGTLWVAQNHGVVQIMRGLGATRFDRGRGMPDASTLVRHQGQMYAGGLAGLYRLQPATADQSAHFELIEHGPRNVWELASHGGWLWVAGRSLERYPVVADGRLGDPERIVQMMHGKSVQVSQHVDDRLYFAGTDGAAVIDAASSSTPQVTLIPLTGSPIQLAEESSDAFWVGDESNLLWRVQRVGERWEATSLGPDAGLPGGATKAQTGQQAPWLLAESGAVALDAATGRFVKEPRWPSDAPQTRLEGLLETADGELWLRGEGRTGVVRASQGATFNDRMFRGIDDRSVVVSFLREQNLLWVARTDGVQRIELDGVSTATEVAPALSLLIETRTGARLPLTDTLDLAPEQRDLRIDYALPSAIRSEAAQFRSRLVGNDAQWSDWSERTSRDYTNLPDGALRFELEARDAYGRTSALTPLQVNVEPPAWRTPLAYSAYVGAGVFLLWLSARFGGRRRQAALLARQRALEQVVEARTHELRLSNAQLAEQAERLAEVDRLKTSFFINVGHEFRTPLSLVIGPIDDLLRDTALRLGARARAQLEMAARNARRVLDLIVELLDVNRFEHGQMRLSPSLVDLRTLARRVLDDHAGLLERHGHAAELDAEPDIDWRALVDVAQIERCLSNLISNAAKYMPRGGTIRLHLQRDGDTLALALIDQGRGIAPAALPHVFDRFFQAEGGDRASGYGIGLALVREIVEAHHGRVEVQSELGLGSTFVLRLPAATAEQLAQIKTTLPADAHDSPEPSEADLDVEDTPFAVAPISASAEDAAQPVPALAARGRPLLLVVDDHDELRAHVCGLLTDRFEVIDAADGASAWNLARDRLPDLILCDVMMPGIDGIELTRRLRGNADTAAIGLLLLTAKVGSEHAVVGLSAGADDYLAKPFDASELLARIDALLGRAQRLRLKLARDRLPAEPEPEVATTDQRWRSKLDRLIAQQLDDSELSIESLAKAMHSDRTQLFRKCKEVLGVSPSEYLRDTRLQRAHELLEQRVGSISEIAYAVGFESLSSFTRAFKVRYGVAPSQINGKRAG